MDSHRGRSWARAALDRKHQKHRCRSISYRFVTMKWWRPPALCCFLSVGAWLSYHWGLRCVCVAVSLPTVELGCGLGVTLLLMLILFVVYHVFWLELLLLYRSWFGTDERHTGETPPPAPSTCSPVPFMTRSQINPQTHRFYHLFVRLWFCIFGV